jgi:hypothetical protein
MVQDHFSTAAAKYAGCRPSDPPPRTTFLGGLAPLRQLAWDCGTGSGRAVGILAGPLADVAAVSEPLCGQSTRLVAWPIHLVVG